MLASKQATIVARPTTTARSVAAAAPTVAPPRPATPAATKSAAPAATTTTTTTAAALFTAATLVLAPLSAPTPAHASFLPDGGAEARQRLEQAEQSFQQSDTLKALLERSEQNRDKNRRAIAAKTCARQAEMGVGDCAGLRFVPGATKSGKQKTPEFLSKILGTEGKELDYEASGKTVEELLAADEARALKKEAEARAAKAAPAVVVVEEEVGAAPALE